MITVNKHCAMDGATTGLICQAIVVDTNKMSNYVDNVEIQLLSDDIKMVNDVA